MRYFRKIAGKVAAFDCDQLTKFELIDRVAQLSSELEMTDQYLELVSAENTLAAIDIENINISSAQSALDSSTFALNLTVAQNKYDLEQSDENEEALSVTTAAYESCDEYIELEAAKEALEQYQIAVQRVESAQLSYESCPECIELERLKSTKIWIPDDAVEMTESEIEAHLNPPISDEQLAATARAQRDTLLEQFTWRYERHARETRLGGETTDTLSVLDVYAQALADVPQQDGFPATIDWPTLPA